MKKFIFVCLLSVLACDTPRESVARFSYTKDSRTNLCFALHGVGSSAYSMTYVPCTDEVEQEIKAEEAAARKF